SSDSPASAAIDRIVTLRNPCDENCSRAASSKRRLLVSPMPAGRPVRFPFFAMKLIIAEFNNCGLNVYAHRDCPCGRNRGSHHRHAERATHNLRGWLVATGTVNDLPVIDTDVLVVGAGPTGLMAGLVLSRRAI